MLHPLMYIDMAGRPPDVSDGELLTVLRESTDPVMFTGEISEELSIGRDAVRERLRKLEEQNIICGKQRGNNIVWWISEGANSTEED